MNMQAVKKRMSEIQSKDDILRFNNMKRPPYIRRRRDHMDENMFDNMYMNLFSDELIKIEYGHYIYVEFLIEILSYVGDTLLGSYKNRLFNAIYMLLDSQLDSQSESHQIRFELLLIKYYYLILSLNDDINGYISHDVTDLLESKINDNFKSIIMRCLLFNSLSMKDESVKNLLIVHYKLVSTDNIMEWICTNNEYSMLEYFFDIMCQSVNNTIDQNIKRYIIKIIDHDSLDVLKVLINHNICLKNSDDIKYLLSYCPLEYLYVLESLGINVVNEYHNHAQYLIRYSGIDKIKYMYDNNVDLSKHNEWFYVVNFYDMDGNEKSVIEPLRLKNLLYLMSIGVKFDNYSDKRVKIQNLWYDIEEDHFRFFIENNFYHDSDHDYIIQKSTMKNFNPIRIMMDHGITINGTNKNVFYYACSRNDLALVKYCIDSGIDINIEKCNCILHLLDSCVHPTYQEKVALEIFDYLIASGADINLNIYKILETAILQREYINFLEKIKQMGINVNNYVVEILKEINVSFSTYQSMLKYMIDNKISYDYEGTLKYISSVRMLKIYVDNGINVFDYYNLNPHEIIKFPTDQILLLHDLGIVFDYNIMLTEYTKIGNLESVIYCHEMGADIEYDDNCALKESLSSNNYLIAIYLCLAGANVSVLDTHKQKIMNYLLSI